MRVMCYMFSSRPLPSDDIGRKHIWADKTLLGHLCSQKGMGGCLSLGAAAHTTVYDIFFGKSAHEKL